jgi:hypothetical protein
LSGTALRVSVQAVIADWGMVDDPTSGLVVVVVSAVVVSATVVDVVDVSSVTSCGAQAIATSANPRKSVKPRRMSNLSLL